MLINTISEVKAVLRVSSLDDNSSIPDIALAEETYIIPVIGQALYDDISTKYGDNTLSNLERDLLYKIHKPLAAYAYYDDLPLHNAIITDAGVRKFDSDNMPSAHRWHVDQLRDRLLSIALQGIESLYGFLEANAASFPLWTASDGYKRRNRFLIKSAMDFNDQYNVYHPFRTYNAILPIMGDVEAMYVNQTIGQTFFEALKANASPSAAEKVVIADLKKAIAQLCMHHAIEKLPVKITDKGITMYNSATEAADQTAQQASADLMNLTMKATRRDGQAYLSKAKEYLDANASPTVFATYYASAYYAAPVADADRVDTNSQHKTFSFIR